MATEYVMTVSPQFTKRHLATALGPGTTPGVPGKSGMSVCGRQVIDYERATYWWARQNIVGQRPDYDQIALCSNCSRITGILLVGPQGERMPRDLASYAHRAARAEHELVEAGKLMRQVLETFAPAHPFTSTRDPEHAKCDACTLLRRVRSRLTYAAQAAV